MIVTIKKKLEETLIPEHLRAAGIIPVLAYDEDDHVFLMDDHSAGFGFMCEPCVVPMKSSGANERFLNQEFPSRLRSSLFCSAPRTSIRRCTG